VIVENILLLRRDLLSPAFVKRIVLAYRLMDLVAYRYGTEFEPLVMTIDDNGLKQFRVAQRPLYVNYLSWSGFFYKLTVMGCDLSRISSVDFSLQHASE